ncbi:MAG: HlyD family type secretion periplasmic adaptor subunit [Devosia sp.]|uniref:HlyD family type I secretion periplasmic adaptor subunit n=1 Tax=Devosia sp. TaxID=1871048 RepID=UPI002635BE2C|nr:HlyD family type I secretion periplasmic adaptor subunit [Devosia sp.]MDB5589468.1 HlyD family type secretion periplasmic adaptor subunit [Devosia sp.]
MTTMDMTAPYGSSLSTFKSKASKPDAFSMRGRVIWGLIFAVLLVFGVGGWSATAKLSGAIIGSGTVLVDEDLKVVQHVDGGVVREIAVRKGDVVAAGQLLIGLDDVQIRAEQSIIRGQLAELLARQARLTAERDSAETIAFPAEFLSLYPGADLIAQGERQLFDSNLVNRQSEEQQLSLQADQLGQEIGGLKFQQTALAEELALVTDERDRVKPLVAKGLVETPRLSGLDRDIARMMGQRGELEANLARAQSRITEIELKVIGLHQVVQNDAQRELRDIQARIAELKERLGAADERFSRTEIRSPVDGIINELNVSTLGGVVTPAERLLTIVPANADLRIEFRLATRDIDQISIGQAAKLRFSAFNQRTTPEIDGVISRLAAAAQRDPQTGESYYLAQVEVTGDLSVLGTRGLIPGMPVEVFVQTAEQTAIAYFAKPFTDQINRTFKEE